MFDETKLKQWLNQVLKNEKFIKNYTLDIEGSTSGVSSDIIFVTIKIENIEKLHLAVKILKPTNLSDANFKTEVKSFEEIIPQFKKLSNEINFYPKYYGCLTDDEDNTIIVLENLNKSGYKLWPQNKPLNSEHTMIVLREYAKYHALSFALKDKKPEVFKELTTKNMPNNYGYFAEYVMCEPMLENFVICRKLLEDSLSGNELLKLNKLMVNLKYVVGQMYLEDPDFSVICHGDCWNNNILFKYQKNDVLESIKIIDWQCTLFSSPVFDVSYFFYTTSGKEQLNNTQKYLDYYYENLSTFLRELGCDPEKLYPHKKFAEHWQKFSQYGFALTPMLYKLLRLPPSALNVAQMSSGKIEDILRVEVTDESLYKSAIFDLFKCFLSK